MCFFFTHSINRHLLIDLCIVCKESCIAFSQIPNVSYHSGIPHKILYLQYSLSTSSICHFAFSQIVIPNISHLLRTICSIFISQHCVKVRNLRSLISKTSCPKHSFFYVTIFFATMKHLQNFKILNVFSLFYSSQLITMQRVWIMLGH